MVIGAHMRGMGKCGESYSRRVFCSFRHGWRMVAFFVTERLLQLQPLDEENVSEVEEAYTVKAIPNKPASKIDEEAGKEAYKLKAIPSEPAFKLDEEAGK